MAWGDEDAIVARVQAHLDAGADHVCVQVLGSNATDAAHGAVAPARGTTSIDLTRPPLDLTRGSRFAGGGLEWHDRRSTGWALILDACRHRWKGIGLGVLVGLGWTAGKVSVGILVARAVDRGIEQKDMGALRFWAVAIAIAAVVVGVFTGLRRYLAFREARWIEADLRDRLFAHLQRLHFAFHDRAQTGQLMSRANTDLQQIQAFVVMIPLTISNARHGPRRHRDPARRSTRCSPLLALGSLPFLNVLAKRFSTRLHPAVMGIQQESAELAAVVEETVAGVRVVKGFGAEPVQAARLARRGRRRLRRARWRRPGVRARFLPGARAAAQHRPDRRARLRRPPGARRRPQPRPARRRSTSTSCC